MKKKKKKNDVHIVWRAYHTKMCTSFFFSFIPQGNEKKSIVNSYNLISCHFHTKSKNLRANSHKIKQNSN